MKILNLILLLLLSAQLIAKENRALGNITVDDYYEKNMSLPQLIPNDYWVLIVLDGNLSSSHEYLYAIQKQKIDMSKTIILLLNSTDSKERFFQKYQKTIQAYSWANTKGNEILTQLNISATPVTLGMHKDKVRWQNSGFPQNPQSSTLFGKQLNNWIKKEVIK